MNIRHGFCGLGCEECPASVAMRTNDNELRARTAAEWNALHGSDMKPEDINCAGCREDGTHIGFCAVCPVRECAPKRGVAGCPECADFDACRIRAGFEKETGIDMRAMFGKTGG